MTTDDDPAVGGILADDAARVAGALRVAARVLSVPALLVAVGAGVGFVVHVVLALTALASGSAAARGVWLALGVAGLTAVAWFVLRVLRTRRAASDPAALAADLVGLVDVSAVTTAVLADLAEVTSREGGVRAVSRARALWRMLRRLDVGEHVSSFERARWFVPPGVAATWLLAQVVTWGGLAAWVLVPVGVGLRLAGLL